MDMMGGLAAAASPFPMEAELAEGRRVADFARKELRLANALNSVDDFKRIVERGDGEGKGKRDEAEKLLKQLASGQMAAPAMYGRPVFSNQDRVFTDLVSYAPGMTTNQDRRAGGGGSGSVAQRSRHPRQDRLASPQVNRNGPHRRLASAPNSATTPSCSTSLGRYAYERTLPSGLREQAVCDGQTLWHLYPELGIGAKRTVSRFHRAFLTDLVPWLVLPAEDLARGADLKKLGENIIAVVPRARKKPAIWMASGCLITA